MWFRIEIETAWRPGAIGRARAALAPILPLGDVPSVVLDYRIHLIGRDYAAALRDGETLRSPVISTQSFIDGADRLRGFAYELMGEPSRARAHYQSARAALEAHIVAGGDSLETLPALARVCVALGEKDAALRDMK
ncbi:MAG: hypothetical protein ACREMQ_01040 [Longimicrobiales bacterium]